MLEDGKLSFIKNASVTRQVFYHKRSKGKRNWRYSSLPRLQIQMLLFKLILLLDGGTDNNFKDEIL